MFGFQSYRDFHGDLFPETAAAESFMTPANWLQGADTQLAKISLDPNNKQLVQVGAITVFQNKYVSTFPGGLHGLEPRTYKTFSNKQFIKIVGTFYTFKL